MHRNNLKNLLQNYNPSDIQEQNFKLRMLEFLHQYSNCFERSLKIGHFTASAWLLNHDQTHALLMHHAKLDQWFQLGGHADGHANLLEVAIKEAQEESGIENIVPMSTQIFDIDVHQIPANSREAAHDHFDVRFLLQAVGDQDVIANKESKALVWFGKDRTRLPTQSPSVVRMFDKWMLKK